MASVAAAPQTIRCPQCDAEVPLDEALTRHLKAELEAEFARKLAAERERLAGQSAELGKQRLALEDARLRLASEVERQVEARAQAIRADAAAAAAQKQAVEREQLQAELAAAEQALAAAKRDALAGLAAKREAEQMKADVALLVAREVDAERKQIESAAAARAAEEAAKRDREKDLVIDGLRRTVDDLSRKLEQGSQQVQGEALELALEAALRAAFPQDAIEPVPKGHRGADVVQHVRAASGRTCGAICWEYKETRNWNEKWVGKLKDDQRAVKADLAVLVSAALPDDVHGCAERDGVWVCAPSFVVPVAALLRRGLVDVASTRALEAGRASAADALYSYLTSPAFRQRLQALVEAGRTMQDELDREKRALQASWERRAAQIERFLGAAAGLYGDVGGRLGTALPPIEQLELPGPPPRSQSPGDPGAPGS
jgi:hypothetical protein